MIDDDYYSADDDDDDDDDGDVYDDGTIQASYSEKHT